MVHPGSFPRGGAPSPKIAHVSQFCQKGHENVELGIRGYESVPGVPPWIRQWGVTFLHLDLSVYRV